MQLQRALVLSGGVARPPAPDHEDPHPACFRPSESPCMWGSSQTESGFLADWVAPGCVDFGDDGCVFAQLFSACVVRFTLPLSLVETRSTKVRSNMLGL